MRVKKVHLANPDDEEMGVCGTYGDEEEDFDNITDVAAHVTCAHCLKHIAKQNGEVSAPEKITFEVTEDLQKALKLIGRVGARWADRTNQCRTYDEAIAHINSKLPNGARIPSRLTTWLVEVSNETGAITVKMTAKSAADAVTMVTNQARYFFSELDKSKHSVKVVGQVD